MVFLFYILMTLSAEAEKVFLKPFPSQPLLNEIVAFNPNDDHKFNLKSKNHCGNGVMVSESENVIECQMSAPGTSQLELYVCDKKNTYCRREEIKMVTQSPQGFQGWIRYYGRLFFSPQEWSLPQRTDVSQVEPLRGFLQNDLKKALFQAQNEKKKLLVYFTQISCSPCRLLKETSLVTDEFQKVSADYVRVQIDIDLDIEPEKIKPLKVLGTPTMIVFDSQFKEIGRTSDLMSPQAYAQWFASLPLQAKASLKESEESSFEGFQLEGRQCSDPKVKEYAHSLMKKVDSPDSNGKPRNELLQKYDEVLTHLKKFGGEDLLQCAYLNYNLLSYKKYVLKKLELVKETKKIDEELLKILNTFPRLTGVTSTTEIDALKAELMGETSKTQYQVQQRQARPSDYTYDFMDAGKAFQEKKYEQALEAIEKSLKTAKDRGWQKAILLKIDILIAMKREAEAKTLIESILAEVVLPASTAPKVHQFVQKLRALQARIKLGTV